MNNKLSCNIVKDLLPAYIDKLTSNETNDAVKSHLNTCTNCSAAFERMTSPDPIINENDAEVDYLRKVRRRTGKIGALCAVCAVLICALIIAVKVFFIGTPVSLSQLAANDLDVDYLDGAVIFSGTLTDSGTKISRITYTEGNGVIDIKAYSVPVLFGGSGTFRKTLDMKDAPDKIAFDGTVIWENGQQISALAIELYNSQNPYIVDMASNDRIAEIIGISNVLDDYISNLNTYSEPFDWEIISDHEFDMPSSTQNALIAYMVRASCILFTSIEDLDSVTWKVKYVYDLNIAYSISREATSTELGLDFSEFAQSPGSFQSLLETLEFDIEHPFRIGNNSEELVSADIVKLSY